MKYVILFSPLYLVIGVVLLIYFIKKDYEVSHEKTVMHYAKDFPYVIFFIWPLFWPILSVMLYMDMNECSFTYIILNLILKDKEKNNDEK